MKSFPIAFANFDLGIEKLDILFNSRKIAEYHFELSFILRLIKHTGIYYSGVNIYHELTLRNVLVPNL